MTTLDELRESTLKPPGKRVARPAPEPVDIQLPRELQVIIWNERASIRMRDYLQRAIEDTWRSVDNSPVDGQLMGELFVDDLFDWLRQNNAVIAGSLAVWAQLGSDPGPDGSWKPNDVDIFIRHADADKCTRRLGDVLGRKVPTLCATVELGKITTREGYSSWVPFSDIDTWTVGDVDKPLLKVQLIVLNNDWLLDTPFVPASKMRNLTLPQKLYHLFDIKICASCFDGQAFHSVDFHNSVRGCSTVVPNGFRNLRRSVNDLIPSVRDDHGPVIIGRSPRTLRPYQIGLPRYTLIPALLKEIKGILGTIEQRPHEFGQLRLDEFKPPVKGRVQRSYVEMAVSNWVVQNSACGWVDLDNQLKRIERYLGRGLILLLANPYATRAESKTGIISMHGRVDSLCNLQELAEGEDSSSSEEEEEAEKKVQPCVCV